MAIVMHDSRGKIKKGKAYPFEGLLLNSMGGFARGNLKSTRGVPF